MRNLILLFTFLCFSLSGTAQFKEGRVINYTQTDGLPSNEAYFIFRDSKNYMWISTDQGVVRYDGKDMVRFILPDNVVFKITEDANGRVWFFSQTGKLSYYQDGKIYPFKYNGNIQKEIKSISVTSAFVSDDQKIFLNSNNGYNFNIDEKGNIATINYDLPEKDSLVFIINKISPNKVFARKIISSGKFFDTAFIYDSHGNNNLLYKIPFHQKSSGYYKVIENQKKELFLYNSNCLIKLMPDGKFIAKEFPADILSLKYTNDNTLLVGLIRNGAYTIDENLQNIHKINFLADKSVTSIEQDYEGGVWFSTLENGIFYSQQSNLNNLLSDYWNGPVFKVCVVKESFLLAAIKNGIYSYSDKQFSLIFKKDYQAVNDLFIDKDNDVIIGASYEQSYPDSCIGDAKKNAHSSFNKIINIQSSSAIKQFDNGQFFFRQEKNYIFSEIPSDRDNFIRIKNTFELQPGNVFLRSNGDIYIGTLNNLYQLKKGEHIPDVIDNDLFHSGISCIRELENGFLAIGLRFGGVVIMNNNKIISYISEKNGLINNSIKDILPQHNNLWIATANGISALTFSNNNFTSCTISNYGKSKGLYDLLIYQLVSFKGDILAATNTGMLKIGNPDSLLSTRPFTLPLYVTAVNFNKDTLDTKSIDLSFTNRKLIFYYSALSYTSSNDIKYYYKFETDSIWNETSGNELIFENLLPGNYELQIRAILPAEKRASDIYSININIEKPWYQKIWVGILLVIVLLSLFYSFYKWRVKKIQSKYLEKASIDIRMAELEQAALRSQMNPHFIFNCLTSIQQLIVFNKNDEANEYLVQFSKLIRKTLEISSSPYISIREEIEYLTNYLYLEKMRQPGQFDFTFKVDKHINIDKIEIPSTILQPLVENSIRHGFNGMKDRKGHIQIEFNKMDDSVVCSIIDNGIGSIKEFDFSKRHGIKNVIQRISLLSNKEDKTGLFTIKNLVDKNGNITGTSVNIKIVI